MAKEFSRTDRVASQIQRELAGYIRSELKDPRLGLITIHAVEVTKDMAHARVFVSVLDSPEKSGESVKVLNHAASFLRRLLGQNMKLRLTPELRFVYDDSVQRGATLDALIDAAIASDEHKPK